VAKFRVIGFGLRVKDADRPWLVRFQAVDVEVDPASEGHAHALAILASTDSIQWHSAPQVIRSPGTALRPLVVASHRTYRVAWFASRPESDGPACAVMSNVNHAIVGTYVAGEWDDLGKLPDDVRKFAMSVQPKEVV
jgi:hypothetical protein